MKTVKNLATLSMLLVFITAMSSVPTFAYYYNTVSVSGSTNYTTAWEKTRTYKIDSKTIASMVYGYDTAYIDEDYTWTKGTEGSTIARVFRDGYDTKGYNTGSETVKNSYSKIEVTHQTYYVYYGIIVKVSYDSDSVTYTTVKSSVK